MQNDKTLEQMTREYEANMPPEIMSIIKAFDWRREMRAIVNQNQLMIDIGADIEQSIYLMIIGAVKLEEFYERLMDVHELPEDKARKIIQEIEVQIFNPLHKKLMELGDDEDIETASDPTVSRDSILNEIEKEPEPVVVKSKFNFVPNPAQSNTTDSTGNDGIVKPFTVAPTKEELDLKTKMPDSKTVEGIQNDPVEIGLKNSTVTQTRAPIAPTRAYSSDPYRESIG